MEKGQRVKDKKSAAYFFHILQSNAMPHAKKPALDSCRRNAL